MKYPALNHGDQLVDNGAHRTKNGWWSWFNKRMSDNDRRLGFVAHVGVFYRPDVGEYVRVSFGAHPLRSFGHRR